MAGSTIRIEVNPAGVREVLLKPEVAGKLMAMGAAVQAAAQAADPEGEYYLSGYSGRNRYRVSVITANAAARKAEAEDRTLTSALNAARGA